MSYRSELAAFRALKVPREPKNISESEFVNIITAIKFFRTLSEKISHYKSNERKLPHKLIGLHDLWKRRIFDWMKFLFDNYHTTPVSDSDSSSPSRWDAISYVSCVFTSYIDENLQLVTSTPGTVELAVRLWINTDYDYQRSPHSVYHGWWGPFLTWNNRMTEDPGFIQKACQVEGVTNRLIANLTLKQVKASTNPENYSSEQYLLLMAVASDKELIFSSIGISVTQVIRAFMSATKGLISYLKNRDKNSDIPMVITCLHYIHFLDPTLYTAHSIEAVCEVINQGAISVIVDFSAFFSVILESSGYPKTKAKEMIDHIICIISRTIPQFMIFDSVLAALGHARVEAIRDDHMAQTLAGKEWATFKRILDNNFRLMLYDMSYIAFCDSPKHHINWICNPSTIFQCSGCKSVWYCSEKCQREHWRDTHKNECEARTMNDRRVYGTIRKRDRRSMLHSTIVSLKYKWEDIKELAQDEGKPLSELSIVFNYSQYPPILGVHPRNQSAKIAGSYINNATIIQCVVPVGDFCSEVITTASHVDDTGDIMGTIWTTGKSTITYLEPDA